MLPDVLLLSALLAMPLQLPADEPAERWLGPAELAGFELEPLGEGAGVTLRRGSEGWVAVLRPPSGESREVLLGHLEDEAAKDAALVLAASLMLPAEWDAPRRGRDVSVASAPSASPSRPLPTASSKPEPPPTQAAGAPWFILSVDLSALPVPPPKLPQTAGSATPRMPAPGLSAQLSAGLEQRPDETPALRLSAGMSRRRGLLWWGGDLALVPSAQFMQTRIRDTSATLHVGWQAAPQWAPQLELSGGLMWRSIAPCGDCLSAPDTPNPVPVNDTQLLPAAGVELSWRLPTRGCVSLQPYAGLRVDGGSTELTLVEAPEARFPYPRVAPQAGLAVARRLSEDCR